MPRFARYAAFLVAAAAIPATATSSEAATKTYHQLSGPRLAQVVDTAAYVPATWVKDAPNWGRITGTSYGCMNLKGALTAGSQVSGGPQGVGLQVHQLNNHAAAVAAFKTFAPRTCHFKIVTSPGEPVGAVEYIVPLSGGGSTHAALLVVGNAIVSVSSGDFGSQSYAYLNRALLGGVAAYRKAAYY